jgi:YidC/Oxa1 family membrane protein insertase
LPFDPHAILPASVAFLSIGVWPILMGATQWFSMKLNPPSPDPVQQRMYAFMPLVFTFMLASFSSGLVIYYAWNNFLTFVQQYVVMRRQGVKVDLLGNLNLRGIMTRTPSDAKKTASTDSVPGE